MSTPPEHAPTEPVPAVATTAPPSARPRGPYDPVARICLIVIAAVMVIMLVLVLGGYHFNVTTSKGKIKGPDGHHHSPKVTRSATP
jgi:hypothetical protein